jgi:HK97 family phage major capsid protein
MKSLIDLKVDRKDILARADAIVKAAESEKRGFTVEEQQSIDTAMTEVDKINASIQVIEGKNTILRMMHNGMLLDGGAADDDKSRINPVTPDHPRAKALKEQFSAWSKGQLGRLVGTKSADIAAGKILASGTLSVATGEGLDSIDFAVPLQVLPYMQSYYALDSFGLAGSRVIATNHMRPINQPVISAGAAPTAYAEGAGPAASTSGSNPFGMSGFQFAAQKYSRQVIADWEALVSAEENPQPFIIDELLASMANEMTSATTTALFNALTNPPGLASSGIPLLVAPDTDTYSSMIALRHAVPPRFDKPTNKWMLSRATLASIRNTKASTSGVPMFDPNEDTIFGRGYVINDFFDSVFGPGAVVYGSWNDGAWLRRTPCITRVLQELYWLNNQIGYLVTQWGDNHFLAELAFASQPPSNQPLYYTTLESAASS